MGQAPARQEGQTTNGSVALASLLGFVAGGWPLAREGPDVHRWAQHFIDTAPAPWPPPPTR